MLLAKEITPLTIKNKRKYQGIVSSKIKSWREYFICQGNGPKKTLIKESKYSLIKVSGLLKSVLSILVDPVPEEKLCGAERGGGDGAFGDWAGTVWGEGWEENWFKRYGGI